MATAEPEIAILDDEPQMRTALRRLLTCRGFRVEEYEEAQDFLASLEAHSPDYLLLDLHMPGLNGFQATRAISRDPETRLIPIILCTSKSQETDKIWGMRQGAHDYMVKPVDQAALLAKIAALG